MYDARTKLAEQVAAEVREHFGDVTMRTVIPRSVRVSEAPGYGMPVLAYDPSSRGGMAYAAAAEEFAKRGDYTPGEGTGPIGVSPATAEQLKGSEE